MDSFSVWILELLISHSMWSLIVGASQLAKQTRGWIWARGIEKRRALSSTDEREKTKQTRREQAADEEGE